MDGRIYYFALIAAAIGFSILGCNSGNSALSPVRGQVLYKGNPLPKGTVVFSPDPQKGVNGPLALASVRQDGNFTMQTEALDGVYPGWYRVTVVAVETGIPQADGGLSFPYSLLPEKYRDPELSGLVCEVKPGKVNRFRFNLE